VEDAPASAPGIVGIVHGAGERGVQMTIHRRDILAAMGLAAPDDRWHWSAVRGLLTRSDRLQVRYEPSCARQVALDVLDHVAREAEAGAIGPVLLLAHSYGATAATHASRLLAGAGIHVDELIVFDRVGAPRSHGPIVHALRRLLRLATPESRRVEDHFVPHASDDVGRVVNVRAAGPPEHPFSALVARATPGYVRVMGGRVNEEIDVPRDHIYVVGGPDARRVYDAVGARWRAGAAAVPANAHRTDLAGLEVRRDARQAIRAEPTGAVLRVPR
jgi:hypothetical protein